MNRAKIVRLVGVVALVSASILTAGCGRGPGAAGDVEQTGAGPFGGGAGGAGSGFGGGFGMGNLDGEMLASLDPAGMVAAGGLSKEDLVKLYVISQAAHKSNWNIKLLRAILSDRSLTKDHLKLLARVVIDVGTRMNDYKVGRLMDSLNEDASGLRDAFQQTLSGAAFLESADQIVEYGFGVYNAPVDLLLPGKIGKLKDASEVGQAVYALSKESTDTVVQRFLETIKKSVGAPAGSIG